ncbi:MAG: hypothetical protein K0R00_135 [Herbinix sp.]|jgi:hypothetical protein|nr:hypothetical protein [Herbinix sp.]
MATMRDIPGTPDWIQSGAKQVTPEQPVTTQQPQPEKDKETAQTTE